MTIVRTWIENTLVPTSIELEGHSSAIRTYAAMRENIYLRDNLLGLVEEPFTGFRVLVEYSLVDRVLELGHILGAMNDIKR